MASSSRSSLTTRILPSGARLALPSNNSSGITRPRGPLTFTLGSSIGFLLGFSLASIVGYTHLLTSYRSIEADVGQSLSSLSQEVGRVQSLAAELADVRQHDERVQTTVNQGARLEKETSELRRVKERLESRMIGLEEDAIALRRRLLRLGEDSVKDVKDMAMCESLTYCQVFVVTC